MVNRLLIAGLLCWTAAGAVYGTLRLSFGPRPVFIHVRWAPSVEDIARQRLEQQYKLFQGELQEGRTWGYVLLDPSRGNIRSLVGNAAVEDTHYIHRTAFRVGYFTPRRPYATSHPSIPVTLEWVSVACVLLGMLAIGLALVEQVSRRALPSPLLAIRSLFLEPGATLRKAVGRVVVGLYGRIPSATPEAVALFRILFGLGLLLTVLQPVGTADAAVAPESLLLRPFREVPWLAGLVTPWLITWGALFIIGAMARTSFVMLTLGTFAWALLYTVSTTHHTVAALLLTLLCLLRSRWSDAWSVDAWRGKRLQASRGTPQEYGFTLWAPSLVLGVVFAAAAFAKLDQSGVAWILNGTVKYHFLADFDEAWVDWGVQLARHHSVAVLLSFGAIAIESLVIVGVLSRRYRRRLVAGIAALLILLGFALFQGVFWPGWWILLLSFLPWHRIKPIAAEDGTLAAAPVFTPTWSVVYPVIIILAVAGQQIVMSLLRLEGSPVLSMYDMYSTTYASPAEFEQKAGDSYWLLAHDSAAHRHECRITRLEAETIAGDSMASKAGEVAAQVLRRCVEPAADVESVTVEMDRVSVDWARWRLQESRRLQLRSVTIRDR